MVDPGTPDAERNDNLKKINLENGFYDILNGEKISTNVSLFLVFSCAVWLEVWAR